jgi:hypothetical protein
MINQYINSFSHISFIEFVVNYNIRIFKKYKKSNIVHWVGFNKHKDSKSHYNELLLLFSPFIMSEMSQKQTYSIWHDAYNAKELSIQMFQNKFINTFGANIVNITKVDWDEIEFTINKLIVEYNDTLWMENFPNHENQINSSNRNIDFVLDVIKPSLHGMTKYDIFLEFHVNQKANNNQFSIGSLQLL